MKNRRRILGIFTATILAIAGTVALVGYVQSAKNDAEAKEILVDVYIVDEVVPKGADAEIVRSSVSIDKVPQRLVQPGAITDLSELGTKVATVDLQPGDQLLSARLVDEVQVDSELQDKVQISTRLAPERAVGGVLAKGDTVGVYLSFPPFDTNVPASDTTTPTKTPSTSHLEFQHVLVTNVQTTREPVTTDQNSSNIAAVAQVVGDEIVVTLALTPEQSERFVFASEFGHVWLSNEPATVTDDGTKLITLGNAYAVVE